MTVTTSRSPQQSVRVLVVAQDATAVASLTAEMMRRSALVALATNVSEAGAAVRGTPFDFIFVCARDAEAETTLLIQLLRGASSGNPRLLFLADPEHVSDHPMAVAAADATVSWALPPDEIADLAVPRPEPAGPAKRNRKSQTTQKTAAADVSLEVAKRTDSEESSAENSDSSSDATMGTQANGLIPAAQTIARAAEAIARAAESIAAHTTNRDKRGDGKPNTSADETLQDIAPLVTLPDPTAEPVPKESAAAPVSVEEPVALASVAPETSISPAMDPAAVVESQTALAPMLADVEPIHLPILLDNQPELKPEGVADEVLVSAVKAELPAELRFQETKLRLATVIRLPEPAERSFVPASEPEVVATPGVDPTVGPKQENRRFYDNSANAAPPGGQLSKALYALGWFTFAAAIVSLTTWPISTQSQFTLGLAVVTMMTVIRKLRLGGIWRPIFLSLGITMILRYVYWRSTATIPPLHDLVNFVPGFILYLAEMYCVLMFFISMFVIADPIERKPPPQLPEDRLPTVDVYIPTYNEGADLLAATVAAATQMDYPKDKFKVYLLDDGGSDQKCNQADRAKAAEAIARRAELQALCADLEITYITRARNEHAKAGNMNNALQQTDGSLIVVFDADHAPARQFLRETVGYFSQDRRLFLVQTPHFFLNPDPVEKNLQTFDRMPSENEMFYGTIQKGLDKWNGAFFCGSAAVISRRALESVGGFSGISITEDCETALDLHTRGWNSLYVDKPLIAGLQPESLISFIGQRSRWCQGMIQILVLKNPLLKRDISLKQRICYVSSMFYWLFPIPRMIFLISPFLYIFFSMQIFVANAQEFFAYVTIYMLTHLTIQNYLYGSTRWPWISEAYEYVQTLYLVKGIWGVLLNPRKPTFNVTAKGITLDNDHLSEMAWPYFVSFGLILSSLVVACWRFLAENEVNELLLIVGGWSFYNLIIAGVALGIVAERRERRKAPRLKVSRKGELSLNGLNADVEVIDASIGGMRIRLPGGRLPAEFTRGSSCDLLIKPDRPDFQTVAIPCTLRNVSNDGSGAVYGLQFKGLSPVHYRGIADAMYSDMATFENFRSSRRKIKGITMGTLQFFWWSVNHTVRAFYYAIALRGTAATSEKPEERPIEQAVIKAHAVPAAPVVPIQVPVISQQIPVRQ